MHSYKAQSTGTPNNLSNLPIALSMAGLTYGTLWLGTAWLAYKPVPLALIENIVHPLNYGILPPFIGLICALPVAVMSYMAMRMPTEIHVRGMFLHESSTAISRALTPAKDSEGINIHPKVRIDENQESRHMFIIGGSGSGKTTILMPMLEQAIARGDKCLVFSFKGDFQEKLEGDFTLLHPFDSRSAKWQLGKDLPTHLDAESLAKTLVPKPDKDPIWSQGAQGLLTAVIKKLQDTRGVKWGYCELARNCYAVLSNYNHLVDVVNTHSPAAKTYLMGQDSTTTMSFLAELSSHLTDVINLGLAEYTNKNRKVWSVRDWLNGKRPATVVIGYRNSAPDMSRAWASSIIEQVMRQVMDMPDVRPSERRIWLFLDEIAQAGKVPSITQGLEAARSKGCRIVLGAQSVSQIIELYGEHVATTWQGQTATKFICQLTAPDDQRWAGDLMGDRELDRYTSQMSSPASTGNAGQTASVSANYIRVTEPVMMSAEFSKRLGVTKTGVRSVLIAGSESAILEWPFSTASKQRPMFLPADWLSPSFVRPDWSIVPVKVEMPDDDDAWTDEDEQEQQQSAIIAKKPEEKVSGADVIVNLQNGTINTEDMDNAAVEMLAHHVTGMVAPGATEMLDLAKALLDQEQGKPLPTRIPQKQFIKKH